MGRQAGLSNASGSRAIQGQVIPVHCIAIPQCNLQSHPRSAPCAPCFETQPMGSAPLPARF